MYTYLLETAATMKPHNNKKWWIDSGIIRPVTIKAENINDALKQYQTIVKDKFYVDISDNAIKTKTEMYIDTKQGETIQTGYVITGKYEFDNDYGKFVQQYIDLWVTINIIINPFTEELKMNKPHEQTAAEFVQALETLINNPENKNNFQLYLSMHFETWLKRFANTPEDITAEIKHFAEMDI